MRHQCIFMAVIIIFLIIALMFGGIYASRNKQQRFEVSDSFGVETKNFQDVFGEN